MKIFRNLLVVMESRSHNLVLERNMDVCAKLAAAQSHDSDHTGACIEPGLRECLVNEVLHDSCCVFLRASVLLPGSLIRIAS